MKHPYDALRPEYSQLLSAMVVRPEARKHVDDVAVKILGYRGRFDEVSAANGVPVIFMGPSFYREASLDFSRNPAQGWPLRSRSKNIPHNGPFPSWRAAALEAYRLNGLDQVGAERWTWELVCYYGETFNGFGPRNHGRHTGYLWAGTNVYDGGKYVADGVWDPNHHDEQLGIVPIARRMVELAPDLALRTVIPPPAPVDLARSADPEKHGVRWLQEGFAELGYDIAVDGNYGRQTKHVVAEFERDYGLRQDGGYAGPEVVGALEKALEALRAEQKSS